MPITAPLQPVRPRGTLRAVGLLLAASLAAAFSGCGSDRVTAPNAGFGTMSGRWDDAAWHGLGYAVLDRDTLYLVGHRPEPRAYYDEYVRVRVPFAGAGSYPVGPLTASLAQITGGDAGYIPAARGELRIDGYTAAPARVHGTLTLTSVDPRFPWRFESGRFDAPIYPSSADVPPTPRR